MMIRDECLFRACLRAIICATLRRAHDDGAAEDVQSAASVDVVMLPLISARLRRFILRATRCRRALMMSCRRVSADVERAMFI